MRTTATVLTGATGDLSAPSLEHAAAAVDGSAHRALDLAAAMGRWLPFPGTGRTAERWRALSTVAAEDLTAARVVEVSRSSSYIGSCSPVSGFIPSCRTSGRQLGSPTMTPLTGTCQGERCGLDPPLAFVHPVRQPEICEGVANGPMTGTVNVAAAGADPGCGQNALVDVPDWAPPAE